MKWVVLLDPFARNNGSYMYSQQNHRTNSSAALYTFHKLLAGVLFEEGFVTDRTVEIGNHESKDWLDLFFGIAGIM